MTIFSEDDSSTVSHYKASLSQHGDSFRSLSWGSSDSQERRFRVLSEIGVANNNSVLDVGCGLGHLYDWFCSNNFNVRYTGIDLTPEMIDCARLRHKDLDFRVATVFDFPLSDSDSKYDYIFASGIFYLRKVAPFEYMTKTIKKMFDLSLKGVAFNSLSIYAAVKEENEYYADPLAVFSYCRTLTPFVSLRHDYHPADFTIYMLKQNSYTH